MVEEGYGTLEPTGKEQRNFRLQWAVALLFGSYEISVSYFLVIISMAYYKKIPDEPLIEDSSTTTTTTTTTSTTTTTTTTSSLDTTTANTSLVTDLLNGTNPVTTMLPENLNLTATTTENLTLSTATTTGPVAQALVSTLLPEKEAVVSLCGSILPDWQSVAVIFSLYTFLYAGLLFLNAMFIRSTQRGVGGVRVSTWQILFHPHCRLLIGLLTFFLICGFSDTTPEFRPINRMSYILCQIAMVVDAGFCFFFIHSSFRPDEERLDLGTTIWSARQLIMTQLKFSIIVCFLSTHINVIVQVLWILVCNTIVYVFWFKLIKSGRKGKQVYRQTDR